MTETFKRGDEIEAIFPCGFTELVPVGAKGKVSGVDDENIFAIFSGIVGSKWCGTIDNPMITHQISTVENWQEVITQ